MLATIVHRCGKLSRRSRQFISFGSLVALLIVATHASAAPISGTLVVTGLGETVQDVGGNNIGVDFGDDSLTPLFLPNIGAIASDGVFDTDVSGGSAFIDVLGSLSDGLGSFSAQFRDFSAAGTVDGSGTLLTYGIYTIEFTSLEAVVPTAGSTLGSVDYGGFGMIKSAGFDDTVVSWVVNVNGGTIIIDVNTSGELPAFLLASVVSAVPLPSGIWLLGSALLGLGLAKKRR